MRVTHPENFYPPTLSVQEAVEFACERRANASAKLLARLVDELHQSGVLSNEQVLRVLDGRAFDGFEAVD